MSEEHDTRMVYLKKMPDGTVEAFGDKESMLAPESVGGGGGVYDKAIPARIWEEKGCAAYVEDGQIIYGIRPSAIDEENRKAVRDERDRRLRACDKISPMRWNAMSEAQRRAWTEYRQALLDVPQRAGFPWDGDLDKVAWPKQPE